jgi:hypothetical protein
VIRRSTSLVIVHPRGPAAFRPIPEDSTMSSPDRARRAARREVAARSVAPIPLHPAAAGIRWSRVATAQARIAADFYQRRDVRDRLIEALLEELDSRPS